MLKSTLIAGLIAAALLNSGPGSAEPVRAFHPDLEPSLNGEVSATGLFPSQAMEDEFNAYLEWTKARGISRLAAFEPERAAQDAFATPEMAEQFLSYLHWTQTTDARRFHAFQVTNFD